MNEKSKIIDEIYNLTIRSLKLIHKSIIRKFSPKIQLYLINNGKFTSFTYFITFERIMFLNNLLLGLFHNESYF